MKITGLVCSHIRSGVVGQLNLLIRDQDMARQRLGEFLKKKNEKEAATGKEYRLEVSLEIHYQARTLDQNRLLRALESIMSMEQYDSKEHAQDFHEGLIQLYCPDKEPNPLTGVVLKKRTSELNTVEFSRVIEGAFRELALMGVGLGSSEDIKKYWRDWYNMRWYGGEDPIAKIERDVEEYRQAVPFCEACGAQTLTPDGNAVGQIAHIKSRGAGGTDDPANLLSLCTDHHLYVQHQQGWDEFKSRFPHLAQKVNSALGADPEERRPEAPKQYEGAWEAPQEKEQELFGEDETSSHKVARIFDGEVVDKI